MVEKSKAAVGPKKAQAGSITRTAAVTKALTTLGKNAMPMQIKGFIKDKFSIEMSNNAVSSYKSEINRKAMKTNRQRHRQQGVQPRRCWRCLFPLLSPRSQLRHRQPRRSQHRNRRRSQHRPLVARGRQASSAWRTFRR